MSEERRHQIVNQHRAVAALARSLAELMEDKAWAINTGLLDTLADTHDQDSLALMNTLGDVLNDMDAVDEDLEEFVGVVFASA
ncbi:MAG: hypothetical protein GY926_22190, partial [bacterium]|nr:hypothetical protein [bacterium]